MTKLKTHPRSRPGSGNRTAVTKTTSTRPISELVRVALPLAQPPATPSDNPFLVPDQVVITRAA